MVGLEEAAGLDYLKKEGINSAYTRILGVEISTEDDYHEEKLPRINPHIPKVEVPLAETWTDMGG